MSDFYISLEPDTPLVNFEIGVPGPSGPQGAIGPVGPAGPNSVTSATTTNFTNGNVLFANSGVVGSLSRNGIDTRTSFPNDDVTAATNANIAGTLVKRPLAGVVAFGQVSVTSLTTSGDIYAGSGLTTGLGVTFIQPSYIGQVTPATLTDDRQWILADRSGTIALTSQADGSITPSDVSGLTTGTANLSVSNLTTATATVSGTLTANHIHGNIAGSVYGHVRAGDDLAKGDPVYISGSHGSGSNLIPVVSKADASDPLKMPAVGVMDAAVSANNNGHMVITGTITELDTDAYTVNTVLYVASGGGWTDTPPAANSQPVAIVERSNTNNGAVIVKVNGLASYGGNGAADANKLVRFGTDGSIRTSSTLDAFAAITANGTAVAATATQNGIAVFAESLDEVSVVARSTNAAGIIADSLNGSYTAEYQNQSVTQSAIERVRGWFVWFYNTFTGRLKTANITANRDWTLPDKSGTILLDSDLGTNVATFLATPTSANLAAAVTNETGSGSLVFGTSPTIATPTLTGEVTANIGTGRMLVNKTASSGVREEIFRATVSDASNDFFFIANGTVSDSQFRPVFAGMQNTVNTGWSLGFSGYVTSGNDASDSSNFGVVDFAAMRSSSTTEPLNGSLGDLVNRKAFTFRSANTNYMTIMGNGSVSIASSSINAVIVPNTKAILDLNSTTKGFLPPRMTTLQRDAITPVPAGLIIYNTTTNALNVRNNSTWGDVFTTSGFTANTLRTACDQTTGTGDLVFNDSPYLINADLLNAGAIGSFKVNSNEVALFYDNVLVNETFSGLPSTDIYFEIYNSVTESSLTSTLSIDSPSSSDRGFPSWSGSDGTYYYSLRWDSVSDAWVFLVSDGVDDYYIAVLGADKHLPWDYITLTGNNWTIITGAVDFGELSVYGGHKAGTRIIVGEDTYTYFGSWIKDVPTIDANVKTFLETPTSENLAAAVTDGTGSGSLVFADGSTLSDLSIASLQQSSLDLIRSNQSITGSPAAAFFDDFLGNNTSDLNWELTAIGGSDGNGPVGSTNVLGLIQINTGTSNNIFRGRLLRAGATIVNGTVIEICFALPTITNMGFSVGVSRPAAAGALLVTTNTSINGGQWTFRDTLGAGTNTLIVASTPQVGDFITGKKYRIRIAYVSTTLINVRILEADANLANWTAVFDDDVVTPTQDRGGGVANHGTPVFSIGNMTDGQNKVVIVDWFRYYNPSIIR